MSEHIPRRNLTLWQTAYGTNRTLHTRARSQSEFWVWDIGHGVLRVAWWHQEEDVRWFEQQEPHNIRWFLLRLQLGHQTTNYGSAWVRWSWRPLGSGCASMCQWSWMARQGPRGCTQSPAWSPPASLSTYTTPVMVRRQWAPIPAPAWLSLLALVTYMLGRPRKACRPIMPKPAWPIL